MHAPIARLVNCRRGSISTHARMAAMAVDSQDTRSSGSPGPPPPDPVYTFRPFAGEVTCVKFASLAKKQAVLTGTCTGFLALWDLTLKRKFWERQFDKAIVESEGLTNNSLLTQCREGQVSMWNIETGEQELSFETRYGGFCKFSLLPAAGTSSEDTRQIVLADDQFGKVKIYNCNSGKSTVTLTTSQNRGMCMCLRTFLSSSSNVLAGFEDGSVVVWDCRNTSQELTGLSLFSEPVMCLDFDPEGSKGVCGSPQDSLEVFKLTQQETLEKCYSVPLHNSGVSDVKVRPDHKIIASGGWDGRIRVFGWKKGKPLAALNYHTAAMQAISFSASPEHSNMLVCGSKDQRVSLWRLY